MPLSPEIVLEAALGLVSDEGLGALSVRALSTRLGVTPMALYRHVGDAAQLERKVIASVVGSIRLIDVSVAWPDACRAWATQARSVLAAYPGVAPYVLQHCFDLRPMLVQVEALLAAALHSGRRGFDAVAASNGVLMYVLMRVEAESSVRRAGSTRRTLRDVRGNPESFPALREHLAHYEIARFDEHFVYGLDMLLEGQERAARSRGGRTHAGTRR